MDIIERLYIHFPFCRHLCNYCDFYKKVSTDSKDFNEFHHYLESSTTVHNNFLKTKNSEIGDLSTLFIGGGTPSLWGETGADFLEKYFKKSGFGLKTNSEFTVEVNPGSWKEKDLLAWQSIGANRFSLGIQSYDQTFIKYLDRVHNFEDVVDTLGFFNDHQLNFSVDFMLGLPYSKEKKRDVIKELENVLMHNPSHISLYILTTKENYIHYNEIPSEDWIEDEYLKVSSFLKEKGFLHYEVSNFAKPGFESQHNLAYWNSESVAALGPSATGLINKEKVRYKWKSQKPEIGIENLSDEEFKLEQFYMSLRTNEGVDISRFMNNEEINGLESLVSEWLSKGLIETMKNHRLTLTSKGFLVMDSLLGQIFSRVKSV
ncbi:MAG: coproporphyrinogen III oxidase family protein [Bacteriovoracaceae bacterium]|nr:coproporphyrinogen III oxidase family protein [Bacteriovoracaceae bacterium]